MERNRHDSEIYKLLEISTQHIYIYTHTLLLTNSGTTTIEKKMYKTKVFSICYA